MFKKLKDKIAEEVKQSPARFQEIINSAQAAVSSASSSSNSDENVTANSNINNSSSDYSSSANENFFSLSEDTPQNSPMKTIPLNNSSTPTSSKPVSVDLYSPSINSTITNNGNLIGGGGSGGSAVTASHRIRRLSNSSVASDVSFRLPHYESQSTSYNLQSDWESASEAEDSGLSSSIGVQLEQISKEHIYQAYRNSLDKYQKYRGRYTEIVRRYRDLEKDNAKARQVLVETQDKALRRISELKEQCQLEQQAKAHLESALRLEMDDMQCIVKTLRTKLELLGENPDNVLNTNGTLSKDESLINFSSDGDNSNEQNELITQLKNELKELREKYSAEVSKSENAIRQLTEQIESSKHEIIELKAREEGNNITMAQNKLMIHSELENKESEVKKLRDMVSTLEASEQAISNELKTFKEKFVKQGQDFELITNDKLKLEERLKEVFEEKKSVNNELKEMKDKIEKVNQKFKLLSDDKTSLQNQNELLNSEIKKCKDEVLELQRQKTSLSEEIKSMKIINESTESEALSTLQENMRKTVAELEEKLSNVSRDSNKTIEDKTNEIELLNKKIEEYLSQFKALEKERDALSTERDTCKSKIESLKNDKRDFEKTLEREIREKNELKVQVTNILQEIGRLEEQLKEVRASHSNIQIEKQKLEEKIEKIQRQHNESKSKLEKDQTQKWQGKVKELETKLQEIQCENSQLAERNCLLEESSRRLQTSLTENQDTLREENVTLANAVRDLEERISGLNDRIIQLTGDHAKLFDEKEQLDHQHRSLQDENEAKEKEKLCLMEDLKFAQEELAASKARSNQLENENSNLNECCESLRVVVNNIKIENEAMIKTRDELQKSLDSMKSELDKLSGNNKNLSEKNKSLKNELDSLNTKNQNRLAELENMLKQTHDEKQSLTESLHRNATDIEKKMKNYEEIKIQNEYLQTIVNQLQGELENAKKEITNLQEIISESEKKSKVNEEISKELDAYKKELNSLKENNSKLSVECNALQKLNSEINENVKNLEEKLSLCNDYDEIKKELATHKSLANETSTKLNEFEKSLAAKTIAFETLNSEHNQLQKENSNLKELLKDYEIKSSSLNDKLKSIENELQAAVEKNKEFEIILCNKDKQISELLSNITVLTEDKAKLEKEIESSRSIIGDLNKDLNQYIQENDSLKEEKAILIEQVEEHNTKLMSMDKELSTVRASKTSDKYEALQSESAKLQEANKELLEKLENLEKSSERKISDMIQEIEELQENSLHFAQVNSELNALKIKYDELLKEKENNDNNGNMTNGLEDSNDEISVIKSERDELADKLRKIMVEVEDVSNKNIFLEQKVENYLILEQSNERLKLTNEKLVRQLDETLVSMHHNEGIQANTEFEYLRNILFQYLSGHVNANGATLVKVIAAVLKFTPQQTQLVLDKENQRHTLLGQLNNLL